MKPEIDLPLILSAARELAGEDFAEAALAKEGIDHIVFLVTTVSGKGYVIKAGEGAGIDAAVFRLLEGKGIKVPTLFFETTVHSKEKEYAFIMMSRFNGRLLMEAPDQSIYMPEVVAELEKIHSVSSPGGAGQVSDVLNGRGTSWRSFLRRKMDGTDTFYDWEATASHPLIDRGLFERQRSRVRDGIEKLSDDISVRLLHTDINSTNLFIKEGHLEGIIDWSDAKFGDPLFDAARLRMHIEGWLDQRTLTAYEACTNFSAEEKAREQLYYILNILKYIAIYVQYGLDERIPLLINLLNGMPEE